MTHEHPSSVVAAIIRANLIRRDERMQTHSAPNPLDLLGPYRGPCGLCGGPDARHRTYDAIRERLQAGDTAEGIAEDYQMDTETVQKIGGP